MEDMLQGFGEKFLILNRVEVVPEWRGRGVGRWFVAENIEVLSDGSAFVATYASPMDGQKGPKGVELSPSLTASGATLASNR